MSDDSYARQFIGPQVKRLAEELAEVDSGPFSWLATIVYRAAAATGVPTRRFTGGVQFDRHGQRYASIRYTHVESARHVGYYTFWVQLDVYQDSASVQDCRYTATFSEPSTLGVGLTFADATVLFCKAIADYGQAAR